MGYQKEGATLQVFIGNDSGKVKPHGFYQACKVCGKTASQCQETDIEGTTVIEIPLQAKDDFTARYYKGDHSYALCIYLMNNKMIPHILNPFCLVFPLVRNILLNILIVILMMLCMLCLFKYILIYNLCYVVMCYQLYMVTTL